MSRPSLRRGCAVERAHGLPAPLRQAPTGVGRPGFRDLDYPEWGVVVELDGRLGHADAVSLTVLHLAPSRVTT
ncbi:hypothetical protein [Gordonia malaquae]|uniref:hypothetical protein n=1 Tax=Gordonia malaquae TaxID=410332 RepID=UPI0009461964|nr:hypothetical protein [Gordonia malaquae]